MGSAVRLVAGSGTGRFVSGPLVVRRGVTLWLDRGTVLAASTDPRAYDRGEGRCGTIDRLGNGCRPFILFEGTQGGGVVGDGAIDGQGNAVMTGRGETWWQLARRAQAEGGRQNNPRLVEVDHAHDVTFYRVTLRNSANFHIALHGVAGATVWGVRIDAPADARNTDGIDPAASQDITIAHSFIRTGDDNIAIKAGDGPTRHVSIVDDHLYWGHGLSIGSETRGGVSEILVRGVTLDGTGSGLRIKSDASRGGRVERVHYEDICLRGNRRPIDFDTRYDEGATGNAVPVYRDILLKRVVGEGGTLLVRGHDDAHALGVTLDDVRFGGGASWQVEHVGFAIGPGGAFPLPPGAAAPVTAHPAGDDQASRCDGRWVPFPAMSGQAMVPGDQRGEPAKVQFAAARTARTLTVGAGARYATIQAAADAAKAGDTILIRPGIYREVVHLRTADITVAGTGARADDVRIEGSRSAGDSGGTSRSAIVFAEADGITIERLAIVNRFHDDHPDVTESAQAVALSATGDGQRFTGLHLSGWQDTLFAGSRGCDAGGHCVRARQFYAGGVIDGAVDFVFGDALAWFEGVELHGVARTAVTLTAQGRRFPDQASGYVFHDCSVTADPSVARISLGRPWRAYATVSYLGCRFDPRVQPQGFSEWQGEHRLATARYLVAGVTGTVLATSPWSLPAGMALPAYLSSPDRFFAEGMAAPSGSTTSPGAAVGVRPRAAAGA